MSKNTYLNSIPIDKIQALDKIIRDIKIQYNLDYTDILLELNKLNDAISFPLDIFKNRKLGPLETAVKYLKENLNLNYHKIALILNRNDRTIWSTYNKAKKKLLNKFISKESKYSIPINIFKDRNLGFLEILIFYLKEKLNLSYHEISVLINRDERTVWSSYSNGLKKRLNEKKRD